MLKYLNIIEQLSDSDKVHILCDIDLLSDRKYRVMGIPALHIASLDQFCGEDLPTAVAMSNSWDSSMVENAANHLFRSMAEQGVDIAIVPGPKPKINPCRSALSEDSLLAGAMTAAYLRAAAQFGVSVVLDDFYIRPDELLWLDTQPDERMLREQLTQPYQSLISAPACKGVLTATDLEQTGWEQVNAQLRSTLTQDQELFFLCPKVSSRETVRLLSHGGLCLQGSSVALEAALERYKQLETRIAHGDATAEELAQEVALGKAISPDAVNEATDRLLRFLFATKRKPTVSTLPVDPQVFEKAHAASMVLLKNERILPIQKKPSLCILGDIAFQERTSGATLADELSALFTAQGYAITGTARGYDLSQERSYNMAKDALDLTANADVVLLFLGLGQQREKLTHKTSKISIPANQQALLDRLVGVRHKVIAIAPPEYCPDVVLSEHCAALLLSPLHTNHCAKALFDVLTGAVSPNGKLASSVYAHTDELYQQHRTYKFRDGLMTGGFLGYRYYDTAQCPPPFPFGHGLSYNNFSYSQLSISGNVARFTVVNRSKMAGSEIAQIYIGKPQSAVLRPVKELAGFTKITLAPGERKTVEVPFVLPAVYDVPCGCLAEEEGKYTVSVGVSLEHIRLSATITAGSTQVTADGRHLSAYIQTESNILSDHFKLEAKYKTMKKSVFNYILGGLMLLLAVALKVYCGVSRVGTLFFDLFSLILGLVGAGLFVSEAIRQNRIRSQERDAIDDLSQQEFSDRDATVIPSYDAKRMFVKEFDDVESAAQKPQQEGIEGVEADLVAYIDKDQTFPSAIADFTRFAAERGCQFSQETVRDLFSSLASSHLLVLRGMDDATFKKFMSVLSGYFQTNCFIDRVDGSYDKAESVLFRVSGPENKAKTNALLAIEASQNNKHMAHFAGLSHVLPENLPLYFTPYVHFSRNPLGSNHVVAANERGVDTSYHLPRNLWFVLNLEQGKLPHMLPEYVSEVAVVNQFPFESCHAEAHPVHVPSFSYHQLVFLTERAVNRGVIDEAHWRKLDRLEKYVRSHTDFTIANKSWLCMETYAYVYMACQGDVLTALDQAIGTKLMPLVLTAMHNKLTPDDPTLEETIETILGEEWPVRCKKLIRECSVKQGESLSHQ